MTKIWLLGIFLSFSWAAQAKDSCTLSDILLKPAQNNVCYDRLIAQTKNVEDRKWLLNKRNLWEPPTNMQLKIVPGGLEVFYGDKHVGGFQWLSISPPILYWNGEVKIGKETKNSSVIELVKDLLHESSTASYFYQSLIPEAKAADRDDETLEPLLIFYALGNDFQPNTAIGHMSKRSEETNKTYFPDRSTIKEMFGASIDIQCTPTGIQNAKYKTDEGREFSISQTGADTFQVTDLAKNVPIQLTYKPSPIGSHCLLVYSTKTEKACTQVWDEFLAQNSEAKSVFEETSKKSNPGGFRLQQCGIFRGTKNFEACENFFIKKFPLYTSPSGSEFAKCYDPQCKQSKRINNQEFAQLYFGLKTIAGSKINPSSFTTAAENAKQKVDSAVQGAAVLGACCKTKGCPDLALKNYQIRLKDAPAAKVQP